MLILGTDKTETIIEHLPEKYLLIDDGAIVDAVTFPRRRKITRLDFTHHSFNPMKGMDYHGARRFITLLDAVFPEGANTLTHKNSNFILLNALLARPKSLDTLIHPNPKDAAHTDAYQKIQTLLLSPVLKNVLCRPNNFTMDGILIARLDRAVMGDMDCFVLGNLLAATYQGQIVIPDFGFYSSTNHIQLMRQHRLIAGLNYLDEVPLAIRQNLLLMDEKLPRHCTFDDAECLAGYEGFIRGTVGYNDFVEASVN